MINDASQKHKASQRHWVCYIARAVFQEPAGEILRSKQRISYHSTANYCKASKATHAESKRRRAEPPVIPGSYVYWGLSYARTQHRMTNHHNTLCFPSFLSSLKLGQTKPNKSGTVPTSTEVSLRAPTALRPEPGGPILQTSLATTPVINT